MTRFKVIVQLKDGIATKVDFFNTESGLYWVNYNMGEKNLAFIGKQS